jgi:hypothetical protein
MSKRTFGHGEGDVRINGCGVSRTNPSMRRLVNGLEIMEDGNLRSVVERGPTIWRMDVVRAEDGVHEACFTRTYRGRMRMHVMVCSKSEVGAIRELVSILQGNQKNTRLRKRWN